MRRMELFPLSFPLPNVVWFQRALNNVTAWADSWQGLLSSSLHKINIPDPHAVWSRQEKNYARSRQVHFHPPLNTIIFASRHHPWQSPYSCPWFMVMDCPFLSLFLTTLFSEMKLMVHVDTVPAWNLEQVFWVVGLCLCPGSESWSMLPMACLKWISSTHRDTECFNIKNLMPQNVFSHIHEENRGEITEDSFLISCLKQKKAATQYRIQRGASGFTSRTPCLHGW